MMTPRRTRQCGVWMVGAVSAILSAGAVCYAGYLAVTWLRYGHAPTAPDAEADALLDRFMPRYDIVERHQISVAAPAKVTFGAAMDMSLDDSLVIRAIFKGREILLRATPAVALPRRSLVETTKSLGWVVLAELPGEELVMGAVTRPWQANVVFRSIPADRFAAFAEPDYVKIVWTLRADATKDGSIARSETRAIATDANARSKFRWYWARFSPGIVLIREVAQRLIKKDAERRAQSMDGSTTEIVVPPVSRTSI